MHLERAKRCHDQNKRLGDKISNIFKESVSDEIKQYETIIKDVKEELEKGYREIEYYTEEQEKQNETISSYKRIMKISTEQIEELSKRVKDLKEGKNK